jgi:hypothetical protein
MPRAFFDSSVLFADYAGMPVLTPGEAVEHLAHFR